MDTLNEQWVRIDTKGYKKIYYNPIIGKIKISDKLNENKIISEIDKDLVFKEQEFSYLYLFPTSDCNLRCTYCYASAGENKKYLDFKTAKAGIDYILEKNDKFKMGFHGGGEPLMNFKLIKKVISYIKELGINPSMALMTNGNFNKETMEWCGENMTNVSFSLDGYKEINDRQRPRADGRSSYDSTVESLRIIQEYGLRSGIRSTITNQSVNKMLDIVTHFHSLNLDNVKLEPLFVTGRSHKNKLSSVNMDVFVDNFILALDYGMDHGMDITSTFSNVKNVKNTHCGASGSNFCITPEGHISSCVEVSSIDDPAADVFIYGHIEDNKVKINEEKLKNLRNRVVDNIGKCDGCFLKYNCTGGCLIKAFRETGNLMSVSEDRCKAKKRMVEEQTKLIANKVLLNV